MDEGVGAGADRHAGVGEPLQQVSRHVLVVEGDGVETGGEGEDGVRVGEVTHVGAGDGEGG